MTNVEILDMADKFEQRMNRSDRDLQDAVKFAASLEVKVMALEGNRALTLADLLKFQQLCWLVTSDDIEKITRYGQGNFFRDPLGWLSFCQLAHPSEAEGVFQMIISKGGTNVRR